MSNKQYTLVDLLEKGLQYDNSWAIYALGTGPDSPARVGKTQFEQGGILDGKELVINGTQLGDAISAYTDGDENFEIDYSLFLDWLIEEDWIEYHNPECYQDDPGCPSCGGVMYGADFPNGDEHGSCLNCGQSFAWDNDDGVWIEEI